MKLITIPFIICVACICSVADYPEIVSDDINTPVTNEDFSIFEFKGAYDTKRNKSKITFRITHKGVLADTMNIESSYRHNQDVCIKSKLKEVFFGKPIQLVTIENFDISKSPIGEYGSCGFWLGLTLNKSNLNQLFILTEDVAVWKSNTATPGNGIGCLQLRIDAAFNWYDRFDGFYESAQYWKSKLSATVVSSNNLFKAKYLIIGTKKFDLKNTCYIKLLSGNVYTIDMIQQNDWLMTNIIDNKLVPLSIEYEDGTVFSVLVDCDYKRKFKALSF